jgi:transposase InsO family protein
VKFFHKEYLFFDLTARLSDPKSYWFEKTNLAPVILHSDNGREFVISIIIEFHSMRPDVKIVQGKPRHSQSQGSVERANRDVEDMLTTRMAQNKSKDWPSGLKFIQFQKNRALHLGMNIILY